MKDKINNVKFNFNLGDCHFDIGEYTIYANLDNDCSSMARSVILCIQDSRGNLSKYKKIPLSVLLKGGNYLDFLLDVSSKIELRDINTLQAKILEELKENGKLATVKTTNSYYFNDALKQIYMYIYENPEDESCFLKKIQGINTMNVKIDAFAQLIEELDLGWTKKEFVKQAKCLGLLMGDSDGDNKIRASHSFTGEDGKKYRTYCFKYSTCENKEDAQ